MFLAGVDIGGTKCAVSVGMLKEDASIDILYRKQFPTDSCAQSIQKIFALLDDTQKSEMPYSKIGISCGGPLDVKNGTILNPPNLPGWEGTPIVSMLQQRYQVPVRLMNDANACALAEWRYGAGKMAPNMAFLTCGTGLGAGLILNGQLYEGGHGMAGELGHIRLTDYGPVGYGKAGSFEGLCSGSGIADLGRLRAVENLQRGTVCQYCPSLDDIGAVSAKSIAQWARKGDLLAMDVLLESARWMGRGLAIIADLLDLDRIVLGGVYARCWDLISHAVADTFFREALTQTRCPIVPAALGESVGDYSALCVAFYEEAVK